MKHLRIRTILNRKNTLLGLLVILLSQSATALAALPDKYAFRQWAQTPPMGWDSWDCYGPSVTEQEIKANADFMANHLKSYGWNYVIVDIRWYVENQTTGQYNIKDPIYVIDKYGRYQPAVNRFPSAAGGKGFKALADYIHSKGLKFGIHIMRGIPKIAVQRKLPIKGGNGITADQIYSPEGQCKWLADNYTILADRKGAQDYYNSILDLYASWGVDYIKVDDLSSPYHQGEIEMVRKAIDQCGRPIVLSTSPGETPIEKADHVRKHANMWRMVNDVWDNWSDLTHLMQVARQWYPYIAPGTWPDCDMIPLGHLAIKGERGNDRMTKLTKDEQYSLMTFFTIFRSPLIFGGDLPSIDPFTLSLLTNQDVLRMHKESQNVRLVFQDQDKLAITSTDPHTGTYLAVFNLSDDSTRNIKVNLKDLGLSGSRKVRDLWSGKSLGKVNNQYAVTLRPHASILVEFLK